MDQENEDLVLLERVFLGVVMSETDEQFENIINNVLLSIIQKLGSPSEQVRTKVIELLTHISKRMKATKSLKLPISTLVSQYSDPTASTFVINFTIIYIKIGFPRLSNAEKFELLPQLLASAVNKPLQHQESILVLLISSINGFAYPRDEALGRNLFGLEDKAGLKKLLLSILADVFMFPYGCTGESNLSDISVYSYRRLIRDGFLDLTPHSLEKLKVDCLRLLSCGLYTVTQEYPPLVLASSDARSSVTQLAEDRIKKILPDIDMGKSEAVAPLYQIYLGTDGGDSVEHQRRGIPMRLRLKILYHLAKFTVIIWPVAIKVLFESLYGPFADQKLRMFALTYAAVVIKYLEEGHLKQVAQILLDSGLLKLIDGPQTGLGLREKTFPIISQLVRRCPFLVASDRSLLTFMFNALEEAGDSDLARVIRDSTVSMCEAFKGCKDNTLPGYLETKLTSGSAKVRSLALIYISNALITAKSLRTYLLLYASCISDDEVRKEAKKSLYSNAEGSTTSPQGFPALLTLVLERDSDRPHPTLLLREVILYLRLCLAADAGVSSPHEQVSHPSEYSPLIGKYLAQMDENLLDSYSALLYRLLFDDSAIYGLSALLEVIGCHYPTSADKFLDRIDAFKKLSLDGNSDAVKDLASEIWGTLASRLEPPPFGELSSHIHALSHLLSRLKDPPLQYLDIVVDSSNEGKSLPGWLEAMSLLAQSGKLQLPESRLDWLVDFLLETFLTNDSNKSKEKSVTAIGYVCAEQVGTKLRSKVIDKLLSNPKEVKDIEVILASGQTLVSAILGSDSPTSGDPWTREKFQVQSEGVSGLANSSVERILSLVKKDRRPAVRQTVCFWLLAVTKNCSKLETVKTSLDKIQGGFIDLLNDNNSLIQEGAGKGLALVYEAGDESSRADLVRTVVEQLGSGKRLGQVSEETKLFEEGELGETPTGEKLSTYKELCTLASDLNQPDLIYKFMSLAHHNAIWNSKKGAAFTVASLAQKAGPEMQEYLPSVLVRMYRYQYDPVGHVKQAMSGIWASLATQDTVVKYRREIFDDLLSNLTGREWRVRYSSCRGLADLMRGPSGTLLLQERKEKMGELWLELFRVMDDIHKETRLEATRTAAAVAKLCAIPEILPVLLDKGITNPAAEVRILSLATINEMLKKGLGDSDVVKIFTAYLKNELDPRSFVQYVKVGMMEDLTSALIDSLKHSVRGGRVSTANVITLISHHLTLEEIQPFVGKFLGALLSGVKDKNRKIRVEFGLTIGHLLRCAKASSVQRLFERLTSLYMDFHAEEEVKWGVTDAVDSSIRHSQEAVEQEALPLVFLAKHEVLNEDKTNQKRIEIWEEGFKQICPGVGRLTVLQAEIAALLLSALKSQYWGLKAQGGWGVRTLANRVPELTDAEQLFSAVGLALEGRAWPGKEALLSPLPFLGQTDEVRRMLIRESGKGNSDYRAAALVYLGETKPPFATVSSAVNDALGKEDKKVLAAAISLLGKCTVEENEVGEVMKLCIGSLEKVPCPCLESLAEVSRDRQGSLFTGLLSPLLTAVVNGLGSRKQASLRRSALNLLHNLQQSFKSQSEGYCQVKEVFDKHSSDLEKDTDPGVRSRTIAIKEMYKEAAN